MFVIAVDLMGGDQGPSITIPGVITALKENVDLRLLLVGSVAVTDQAKQKIEKALLERVSFQYSTQVVTMDEKPVKALREKKDSSMHVAMGAIKAGIAQGFVSAGNTGALMAISRYKIGMTSGITRPAIMGLMPTVRQGCFVHMLDLGANVESTAEHLVQFALMGKLVAQILAGLDRPQVRLLNIGHEAIKGTESVKQADKLLRQNKSIDYQGYMEPNELFSGEVDVLVCDGFVGNSVLKTVEGTYYFFRQQLATFSKKTVIMRLLSPVMYYFMRCFSKHLNPEKFNGAVILGLDKVVVKSHGSSDSYGFSQAILRAYRLVDARLSEKIAAQVTEGSE
jgi:phosphate acyltransferase